MANLSQDIQDAIRKNLSEATAGELKQYIEQAEQTAKKLDNTEYALTTYLAEIQVLKEKLAAHQEISSRGQALVKREKELIEKERALATANANNVAEVAVAEKNATLHVVEMFLKNTTVRSNVMSQVCRPVEATPPTTYNQQGTSAYLATGQETHHTTQQVE